MTPRRHRREGRPLVCPYCGSDLEFELAYTSSIPYSEHRDLASIECGNYECLATWTARGAVDRLPKP